MRLTRRIRVLEERITPDLHRDIHAMAQYLAERERETYFRLKRFKGYATRQSCPRCRSLTGAASL